MDTNKRTIGIYCDGGARGNPGPAAGAFVVKNEKGSVIYEEGKYLGTTTNNVAEYKAVIMALNWLKGKNLEAVIFGDSELVGKQLRGEYKIKNKNLIELVLEIRKLEREMGIRIIYKNILRSQNRLADLLVNRTLNIKGF